MAQYMLGGRNIKPNIWFSQALCFSLLMGKFCMIVAISDPISQCFLLWISFLGSVLVVHLPRRHGCIFHNLLFWKTALEFSPGFSLQAVRCFFQVLVLDTFAVGPKLFPLCWETCIFVATLTLFSQCFLLWISFLGSVLVVLTTPAPLFYGYHGLPHHMGWIFSLSFGVTWFQSNVKAMQLSGGNFLLHKNVVYYIKYNI